VNSPGSKAKNQPSATLRCVVIETKLDERDWMSVGSGFRSFKGVCVEYVAFF